MQTQSPTLSWTGNE